MLRHELAVEKREIAHLQPRHEPGESHLRGIRCATEHALAEKGAAELHAIKSADEVLGIPDLERVRMARGVEREHRPLQIRIDPRLLAVRACGDHRVEVPVMSDRELAGTQGALQRSRQMKPVEGDDGAVARLDPEELGRIAAVGHREDPGGITLQQQARVEATHAAVFLQNLPDLVLWPAKADAIWGLDDGSLDQDRVSDHRIQHLVVGDVRPVEPQVLCQRFLGAQAVPRADPGAAIQADKLVAARRLLQIFVDPDVAPFVPKDIERLAGRTAHRVVKNCSFHRRRVSPSEFRKLNKELTCFGKFCFSLLSRLRNDGASPSFQRL